MTDIQSFAELVRKMRTAAKKIDDAESSSFSEDDLSDLEDIRHHAFRLALAAETAIQEAADAEER